jgi:hypothetical protein
MLVEEAAASGKVQNRRASQYGQSAAPVLLPEFELLQFHRVTLYRSPFDASRAVLVA